MANCPVCGEPATQSDVNLHLDKGCPKKLKREWSFMAGTNSRPNERQADRQTDRQTTQADRQTDRQTDKQTDRQTAVSEREPQNKLSKSQPVKPAQSSAQPAPSDALSAKSSSQLASTAQSSAPSAARPGSNAQPNANLPLAEQMRPKTFDDYVGQTHITDLLKQLLPNLPSMILWGPSGSGKTTLARVLAGQISARFVELSAPSAGATDVRKIIADARREYQLLKRRTVLFLDEIHRFNRSQQDSLLQGVERGDVILIGATTENPSFKLTGALLSRTRVFVLSELAKHELREVVRKASPTIAPEMVDMIVKSSGGDARRALNMLETVKALPPGADPQLILKHTLVHDQRGDNHYDLISAFHKSVRGSDADAALYYLACMLCGGEDPLYVSRRMIRIASEDVGLADDSCLPFCVAAHTAVQQIGMPECDVMLAHAAVKLARAPKSVDVYKAYGMLKSELAAAPPPGVPLHLRNAPTKLMEDTGYSKGYKYNPAYIGEVKQEYLPKELEGRKWLGTWKPTERDE